MCPESFPKLWSPILGKLVNILPGCAKGYARAMLIHVSDVDEAFKCNDAARLSVWFQVYATLFDLMLPFIDDGGLKNVITKGICDSKALQSQTSNGVVDMHAMQGFFGPLTTKMDDSLNNYCPPPPCPPPRKPLINIKLL